MPISAVKNAQTLPPVPVPAVGTSLCERAAKLMIVASAFERVVTTAKREAPHIACSGMSLVAGLAQIYQGNYWTGLALTGAGALSLKKAISTGREGYPQLRDMLQDADASTSMIRVLEEANGKSFEVVSTNLNAVQSSVADLNSRMGEIQTLAQAGSERVQQFKAEADKLAAQSQAHFACAEQRFSTAQKAIGFADQGLAKTLDGFATIIELAQSDEGDLEKRVASFTELSKSLCAKCNVSREALELANDAITDGLKQMQLARQAQEKVAYIVGQAVAADKAEKAALAALARQDADCAKRIGKIQDELNVVRERNADKAALLDDIHDTLQEAQAAADDHWDTASITGAMAAASATTAIEFPIAAPAILAAFLVAGPVGAAAAATAAVATPLLAGAATGTAMHHRFALADWLSNRIYGQLEPKKPEDFTALDADKRCKIAFDKRSSGVAGKLRGNAGSKTVGDVQIDLGAASPFTCRFNVNKKSPIRKDDLIRLQRDMIEAVEAGTLSKPQALKLLTALTTTKVREKKPLIDPNSPYLGELKRICKR